MKIKLLREFVILFKDFDGVEYLSLKKLSSIIQEYFLSNSMFQINEQKFTISTPKDLLKRGLDQSKKGSHCNDIRGWEK